MQQTNDQPTNTDDATVMPQEETTPTTAPTTPSLEEFLAGETPVAEAPEVPAEKVPVTEAPAEEIPAGMPIAAPTTEGEIQSLANEVAQALVELEKLKDEKDTLEKDLKRLQEKHNTLDKEITEHKQRVTELLEKVQKAIS